MEIKEFVKHYDIIPPTIVADLIKFSNKLSYSKSGITGGSEAGNVIDDTIRNVEEFCLSRHSQKLSEVKWFNVIRMYLMQAFRLYCNDLLEMGSCDYYPKTILDINILKYQENYFYKKHIDHHPSFPRTISIVIFLNNDYEGGDLCFEFNKTETIKIKPSVGRILLWPSTFLYPHYVEPVTKGTRYVIVSWAL
jgi:hypothetical protein